MSALRRVVALVAVLSALSTGLAAPAHADHRPPPKTGDVCDPHIAIPGSQTVDFWVENVTDLTFFIARSHLNQGVWSTAPPVKIEPGEVECWRNVYNGPEYFPFLGAQGWVTYFADGIDSPQTRWTLVWYNPSLGNNSFECRPVYNHSCAGLAGSGSHPNHPTPIFRLRR